jgi:hypothetical protein
MLRNSRGKKLEEYLASKQLHIINKGSITFIVSSTLNVSVPSGFRSVVMILLVRTFPVASLHNSGHGFEDDVTLQYSFHELSFSLFF